MHTGMPKSQKIVKNGLIAKNHPRRAMMAGPIRLKLGGMVEGMGENDLAKEFFGSVEVDWAQVSGPQVPLLGRGDDKETLNWT